MRTFLDIFLIAASKSSWVLASMAAFKNVMSFLWPAFRKVSFRCSASRNLFVVLEDATCAAGSPYTINCFHASWLVVFFRPMPHSQRFYPKSISLPIFFRFPPLSSPTHGFYSTILAYNYYLLHFFNLVSIFSGLH